MMTRSLTAAGPDWVVICSYVERPVIMNPSHLGFPCVQCGHPVVIFDIPADKPTPVLSGGKTRMLRCGHCGKIAQYHMSNLRRFDNPEQREA